MIQLRALALWNARGEIRRVDFDVNGLNIITGEAKAGKSAVLEIVEFCLGRSSVSLPQGVLTKTVDWYGLLLAAGDQTVFVGRPGPREGQASVSGAHLEIGGPGLEFPAHAELEANTNADAVTTYLTRMVGIGEYENAPPSWSGRPPLRPTIRHAALFCFQRQNEIANPRQLFHRQDEDFMPQAIKDTLPYFLGAVNREAPTLRSQLSALRRELRRAERRLEETQQLETRGPVRSQALLAEAVDAGLVPRPEEEIADPEPMLREALEAPVEPSAADGAGESEAEYSRLTDQSRRLTTEIRAVADQAAILRRSGAEQADYGAELAEQAARLETLGLLPEEGESDSAHCPVCGSAIEEVDATVAQLIEAAAETRVELEAVAVAEPGRRAALGELEERAESLRQELRTVHAALAALSRDRDRLRAFREQAMARAFIKGRIAQHLEELERVGEISGERLEAEVRQLHREVGELEERLDPENERQQVLSRLNVIGEDMTEWADRLGLEHTGGRVRIDPAQLTVVVDTADGPIPLERMGSASNWVGYHLVAHFGLHRWFAQRERPVPRFLMLDQPTQAFYPPDVEPLGATDVDTSALSDDDRASVERMFTLMHDMVTDLAPGLQIIVMDHANLSDRWFQDSIVEVWRGGLKLVPESWLAEQAAPDESP